MEEQKEDIGIINSRSLEKEFRWFAKVLATRIQDYFIDSDGQVDFLTPPDLTSDKSNYAQLIKQFSFGVEERLVLCLAIAPHIKPQLLDLFLTKNPQLDRPFTEFGGYFGNDHIGFLPTGQTALFLIASDSIKDRVLLWDIFSQDHPFISENIIFIDKTDSMEPYLSGRLMISSKLVDKLTLGETYDSKSLDLFPAKLLSTELDWSDLVVEPIVMEELLQIKSWIENRDELNNNPSYSKFVKPGYRSLFYGPPGTGKILAAALLGKACNLEVYRVDLSMIVSNYIGETEKNMERIFDFTAKSNCILLFDEADTLFGKRTQSAASNDRFANQEVAYILQRIEDYAGLVILASNQKSNIDDAFSRRFQSILYFPPPNQNQRLQLWQNIFKDCPIKLADEVDLERISSEYELSGGSMINVFQRCILKALQRGEDKIGTRDIIVGIRIEYQSENKTL